jgi:nucleoside-diphosphate-sugar epimerase
LYTVNDSTKGTICVTGAAGYIGSHVVATLLRAGYRVNATVRDPDDEKRTEHLRALTEGSGSRLTLYRADLLAPGAFDEAVSESDAVCHIASAVRLTAKEPKRDIVDVAVKGTRNVLDSVARHRNIKRVILTSSIAAVVDYQKPDGHTFTEEDWAEDATVDQSPYALSKTLAEQNAWAFRKSLGNDAHFDLVSLNPSVVIGPVLSKGHLRTSPGLVHNILSGRIWGCPRLHFNLVDVRDVADAHLRAIEAPSASGRYILTQRGMWWREIAESLRRQFPSFPVKTRQLPDSVLYAAALFDKRVSVSFLRNNLGRRYFFNTARSASELGLRYRDPVSTLHDTCRSLIERGWVQNPA